MKPEAKLIAFFVVALTATLLFYDDEPTPREVQRQEARAAGVLQNTADL